MVLRNLFSFRALTTLSFLGVLTIGAAAGAAPKQLPGAMVLEAIGDVKFGASNEALHPAQVNKEIPEGAHVFLGKDSYAKLKLADDSLLELGPESQIEVARVGKNDQVQLNLEQGKIRALVKHRMDGKRSFRVHTHGATMGVRGTFFVVSAQHEDSEFFCMEGSIAVSGQKDKSVDVLLKGGDTVKVEGDHGRKRAIGSVHGKVEEISKDQLKVLTGEFFLKPVGHGVHVGFGEAVKSQSASADGAGHGKKDLGKSAKGLGAEGANEREAIQLKGSDRTNANKGASLGGVTQITSVGDSPSQIQVQGDNQTLQEGTGENHVGREEGALPHGEDVRQPSSDTTPTFVPSLQDQSGLQSRGFRNVQTRQVSGSGVHVEGSGEEIGSPSQTEAGAATESIQRTNSQSKIEGSE